MPIEITYDECAAICEALRHQADCRNTTLAEAARYMKNTDDAPTHRRNEATRLNNLANAIEGRAAGHLAYESAMQDIRKDTTP